MKMHGQNHIKFEYNFVYQLTNLMRVHFFFSRILETISSILL